ncbi:undecaprenyl-diphosphatase [Jatrophihabitans endophyticus]|uniref:Undecaprenyl-diphosphatase n=1 Tax=Jatrophihabitans endophyticus TaxID=1206085 RepID=A0A1M5E7C5_9ACTN|nr:phosphatase PAP2 family protein [Jatrophihabitans endophyticus]SHF74972.1 undecaprenyl-diphosphatase [Jatrophihabitans endophyticus]
MTSPRRPLPIAATAGVAFLVLTALVATRWSPLLSLDRATADTLDRATAPHPLLVHAWRTISAVGQPLTWQLVSLTVAILLWRAGAVRRAVLVAGSVLVAGLLSRIVKALVGRARPTVPDPIAHAGGYSFPSGHSLLSFVAVGALLIVAVPRLAGAARMVTLAAGALVVVLVGVSRLTLGVHYASDVVAAWLLGTAWLAIALAALRRPLPGRRLTGRPRTPVRPADWRRRARRRRGRERPR